MHVLHVAAENDRLPGAKVGGIGDVLRDIAPALADAGWRVTLLIPAYGHLHRLPGVTHLTQVGFLFQGGQHTADIYEVPDPVPHQGVRNCVIHHPLIEAPERGGHHRIYVDDGADAPFYTDSTRFACFSAAAAAAIARNLFGPLDALHLHDWHAALVALLRQSAPEHFKYLRTVYTIHNLGIQGIRPLRGSDASLEAWFPGLPYHWLDVGDPRWSDCVNFMATGIRLADVVHTVSPTYAEEISHPSHKPHFFGAEGLETVIGYQRERNRLIGILNGCTYPAGRTSRKTSLAEICLALQGEIVRWSGEQDRLPSGHFIAHQRLAELGRCPRKTAVAVLQRQPGSASETCDPARSGRERRNWPCSRFSACWEIADIICCWARAMRNMKNFSPA